MDELIEQRIKRALEERVFPGCMVGIIKSGEQKVLPFGKFTYEENSTCVTADTIYDLASITKAIPTNSLALKLIDEDKLSAEDQLIKYVPEYQGGWREEIKIKHLMTYTVILDIATPLSSHIHDKPDAILKLILNSPLQTKPGEKFLYTNSPSIMLGMVIERIYDKQLDVAAREILFEPLGMTHTSFHPEWLPHGRIAPTEISDTRGVVQGYVHDEVTWALQKKPYYVGCAGVFAPAGDLLQFAQMLLNCGELKGKRYFSPDAVALMHTNQLSPLGVSYGLGWELNQTRFMGKNCKNTFGKTGFTGTMILINIQQQEALVLLANATYPQRKTGAEEINSLRRDIADIVFREQ